MREIPVNEYQSVLLGVFRAFYSYCKKNGIRMYLGGGTALGALRHGGFIPWDDDIDVFISREDREKLSRLAGENPWIDEEKRYRILPPATFPSVYPFFKVIDAKTLVYEKNIAKKYATGVWIDVFCLSYWADDERTARRQFKRFSFYNTMNKVVIGGNYRTRKYRFLEIFAFPVRMLLLLFGMDSGYWCRKVIALDRYESGEYMGNVTFPDSFEREHYRAEWFEGTTDTVFEGIPCVTFGNVDAVLTHFYGDYMTPPPEDRRIRHNPEAYYLD